MNKEARGEKDSCEFEMKPVSINVAPFDYKLVSKLSPILHCNNSFGGKDVQCFKCNFPFIFNW